jgi:cytidylate kinase
LAANTGKEVHMSLVTIRGQLGSGAPEIGRQVADKLHIDYVDREIIAEVAARVQRDEQDVIRKEMPPGTLMGRIAEALTSNYAMVEPYYGGAYLPPDLIPLGDTRYLAALESVVRGLAKEPSLVIRGRGSQFILKEYPGSLHALVVAPLELRVKRVMRDLRLDEEAARQEITRYDTSRHEFAKRYFQAELEDPLHYDLVINTGRLPFDAAASTIINALR